ncbi:MAG: aspartate kinase [Candidatus Amulumruptor caecigallinarius]|nr:aspartate kinase [Candidatus Amulumruptor caecigallinarius]
MMMKVLKFGGTSVGTIESLRNVKNIVESIGSYSIVVVSALGGLTDKLIATAGMAASGNSAYEAEMPLMAQRHFDIIDALVASEKKESVRAAVCDLLEQLSQIYRGVSLIGDLPERTLCKIVSFGERMSSIIVAAIIENACHMDSLELVKTEEWFNKNIADRTLTEQLIRRHVHLPLDRHIVMGGFISRDRDSGEITNLGRGGSDYTAALVAAALNADMLEIWTDVNGFMTADPRIIPDARVIDRMSFIESMDLCSFGAKVIYPPTIYPVFHKNIPIKILNTHNPGVAGTLITDSTDNLPPGVRGVSSVKNSAVITIKGDITANVAEINTRAYNTMARNGISVLLVAQPRDTASFSLSMAQTDVQKALEVLAGEFAPELQTGEVDDIVAEPELAIIVAVGESIRSMSGLGHRLLNTLQREGIEVKAVSIGTSETTIALVVKNSAADEALRLVHNVCF